VSISGQATTGPPWGAGLSRDYEKGDLKITSTTGTGTGIYFRNNYLVSARASYGVLSRDNFNIGVSGAWGKVLETMGWNTMYPEPIAFAVGGVDVSFLWDNFDLRLEAIAGRKGDDFACGILGRLGVGFLEENRLKLELQPLYTEGAMMSGFQVYGGLSYAVTYELTVRSMYGYINDMNDHRAIVQFYYYLKVI